MKKSKKILISAFAGAFLCAALGGATLCGNQKTVSAAAETLTLTTFKTEDGASVRKDDNYGIRFRASISKDEYQDVQNYADGKNLSAVFGMLVCPQWVLDEKGGELAFDNAAIAGYIEDVPVQVWETENEHRQYACAIVDYPDEKAALTTALTARAYVKDKSGSLVIYADGMATRSLLQTTLAAKANGEEGASLDSIVEKAWQGENPAADYDFSSVIDYDLTKVSAYNGGTVKGIVADSAATDGFALLGNTDDIKKDANGAWLESGFSIAMGNIPVAKYSEINVYLRTSDSFSIYANDVHLIYAKYDSYTKVNLIELINKQSTAITELNEIGFRRKAVNVSIYVDKIEFVQKPYNYDFSSADDNDIYAVSVYSTGTIEGIVADSAAKDGYALKITTGTQNGNGGVFIKFDDLDVSKYEKITLRLRTEAPGVSSPQIQVDAGGTSIYWDKYDAYTELDILAKLNEKSVTTLSSLRIWRNVPNITVYIDCIELVEKA